MTRGEMLAKLEALLERVRSRAVDPRRPASEVRAHAPSASGPRTLEAAARAGANGGASPAQHRPATPAREEPAAADGYDSRERLVAAQSVAAERPSAPAPVSGEVPEPLADSVGAEEVEIEVVTEMAEMADVAEVASEDEEAPVSSRRPLGAQPEEQLEQMAFGADEPPPLHTPPPESGRLPAAPTPDFDADVADVTGVRSSTAPASARVVEAAPARHTRELVPEVTRPARAPTDRVADVVAEAQAYAPETFVALLDASLAL